MRKIKLTKREIEDFQDEIKKENALDKEVIRLGNAVDKISQTIKRLQDEREAGNILIWAKMRDKYKLGREFYHYYDEREKAICEIPRDRPLNEDREILSDKQREDAKLMNEMLDRVLKANELMEKQKQELKG